MEELQQPEIIPDRASGLVRYRPSLVPKLVKRVQELKAALRLAIGYIPNKEITDQLYAALGEEPPPLRKLTGKIPRYQQRVS